MKLLFSTIARTLYPAVLALALAVAGQDLPPSAESGGASGRGNPASQVVPTWPVPPEHPICEAIDVRVIDGDTVKLNRLIDTGISQSLSIRLAPSVGRFNAPDYTAARQMAKERLDALLTTGPAWVQLTGERSFERWVGRVYRREGDGIENVADRMAVEGFNVPRGQ